MNNFSYSPSHAQYFIEITKKVNLSASITFLMLLDFMNKISVLNNFVIYFKCYPASEANLFSISLKLITYPYVKITNRNNFVDICHHRSVHFTSSYTKFVFNDQFV